MKTSRILLFVLTAAALLLQACAPGNSQSAIQTAIAQTLQISQLETAAAGGGQPQAPSNTPEPGVPSDTPQPSQTPSITLTWTPSIPYVSVSTTTNCRTGPGIIYDWITAVNVGEQAEVVQTFSYDYVVIRNPHGSGVCWLWLQYANTHDFSAYHLPQATQPPTPTATNTSLPPYDWAATWSIKADNGAGTVLTGSMTCSLSGSNISCTTTLGGNPYTFTASLNSTFQTATGSYSGTDSGSWQGRIKSGNTNQFMGSTASGWAFCGSKNGASMPDPCRWP